VKADINRPAASTLVVQPTVAVDRDQVQRQPDDDQDRADGRDVPVITGTGEERIYDGYPDVALEMIEHRTFDGRIQLVEYKPRVLEHPPLGAPA